MRKRKLKRQSLKIRFRRALKAFENRLAEEQALKEALGHGTIEGINTGLFKRLNYNELFKKGVTRKVRGETMRFYGREAIELEIKSLQTRTSSVSLKENYIENYITAMSKNNYSVATQEKVRRMLNNLDTTELSIAINENIIPQVYFLYNKDNSEEDLLERLDKLVNSEKLQQTTRSVLSQLEERKEIAKRTYELNKALNR